MTFSLSLSGQVRGQLGWYALLQIGHVLCWQWRLIQNPLPFLLIALVKACLLYLPSLYREKMPHTIQQWNHSLTQKIWCFLIKFDVWISSWVAVRPYENLIATQIPTQNYFNFELIRYCICTEAPSFLLEAAVDQGAGRIVRYFGLRILTWTDFGRWIVGLLLFQKIAKKIQLEG